VVAAAEFLLEGMVAHRKLSRNEQHGFAAEKSVRLREREDAQPERKDLEMEYEDWQRARRSRRGGGLN
jgi:magnesium chelatase subunit I